MLVDPAGIEMSIRIDGIRPYSRKSRIFDELLGFRSSKFKKIIIDNLAISIISQDILPWERWTFLVSFSNNFIPKEIFQLGASKFSSCVRNPCDADLPEIIRENSKIFCQVNRNLLKRKARTSSRWFLYPHCLWDTSANLGGYTGIFYRMERDQL